MPTFATIAVTVAVWLALPTTPALQAQAGAVVRREGAFALRVDRPSEGVRLSLEANRASLRAVAAALSQQLGAPVTVGAALTDDVVSAGVCGLPLEAARPLLAPRVVIDQEVAQGPPTEPRAVYLLSFVDPEPPQRASSEGAAAQGFFLEGNTEDPGTGKDTDPLQVTYTRGLLSVTARQQTLASVARVIADVLGVPLDTEAPADTVVDLLIPPVAPIDALAQLSPAVRTLARFDLNSAERTVLRIALVRPGSRQAR